jgi:YvrJ protein family
VEELIPLISDVGFPIVVTLYLLYETGGRFFCLQTVVWRQENRPPVTVIMSQILRR